MIGPSLCGKPRSKMGAFLVNVLFLCLAGTAYAQLQAAVFSDALPGHDATFAQSLVNVATEAGYSASLIGADDLSDSSVLDAFDVVILPKAGYLPAGATATLEQYVAGGGSVVALQAPLWQDFMIFRNGSWMSLDQYEQDAASHEPAHMIYDFSSANDLSGWQRSFNPSDMQATYSIDPNGPAPGWGALHAQLGDHRRNWDTYSSPNIQGPFLSGHTMTVFAAKGDANTHSLAVEWTEQDGSRWIATIPLTLEWRRYALTPEDFLYWSSPNNEREGTVFNPANARRITVGLALSHLGNVGGPKEYWVSAIGSEPVTDDNALLRIDTDIGHHDGLYPSYKYFEVTEPVAVRTRPDQVFMDSPSWPTAEAVLSPHPRAGGGGFNKGRAWRWIPLLDARNSEDDLRGTPAGMLIHTAGSMKGGQWAFFGIEDDAWYREEVVLGALESLLERMAYGAYIIDGGTQFYTYFDDQTINAGLRVVNLAASSRSGLTARVRIQDADRTTTVFEESWSLSLSAGETRTLQESWTPPDWPEDGYYVVAELLDGETVIDRVDHEAYGWRPRASIAPITLENGEFMRNGQRWRAHGVNYMPSSGIASEDWAYYEYWLGARSYDPKNIQRDLDIIHDLGLNSVSIFLHHDYMNDHNLLDFLRRCEELGLYVNFSMRHAGTTPTEGWSILAPRVRDIITHYRLDEHNIVFAYDLAWEPVWRPQAERRQWDRQWEDWIIERYGSIENAEADWGYAVPLDGNDAVTNPTTQQIEQQGSWFRMVAAYRRFLDTVLYRDYNNARRMVRELDPNTHVSFRMAEAGNPTMDWPGVMAYDFPYLAAAVDILEPEAYGRIGDWERIKPGWFTYEYGRWAGPELPLVWSEAGVSVWDRAQARSTEEKLDFQGLFYDDFYQMMIESAADGIYWWWFAGGFRVGEISDYGIVNPDGSDRPSTVSVRDHAEAFLDGPSAEPVDYWIEFDRDLYVDGIIGVYADVQEEFWDAIDNGHTPGLRTAGTGTHSGNCPLLAVGNTPVTGSNPPKYLDGFFDRFEVQDSTGRWVAIDGSATVRVASGEPVLARMTITNLAEAAWLAAGDGAVVIEATIGDATQAIPLPHDVGRHETVVLNEVVLTDSAIEDKTITVRMAAQDRTPFGPIRQVTMGPAFTYMGLQVHGDGTKGVESGAYAHDLGIDGNKPKTVELWAFVESPWTGDEGGLFAVGRCGGGGQREYSIRQLSNPNRWRVQICGSDFDFTAEAVDRWTHFALVYNGSAVIVYANGQEVTRATRALNTGEQGAGIPFRAGWRGNLWNPGEATNTLPGIIDDVRVWNVARSQEEIQANMHQYLSGEEEGLVLYWSLNEGGGSTTYDVSANEHNGAINDATWVMIAGAPDLTGMTQEQAEAFLAAEGYTLGDVTVEVSGGLVGAQTPPPGHRASAGQIFDLVINLDPVVVPDVVIEGDWQTVAEAQTALEAAGLTVGSISHAHSSTVPEGLVMGQSVPAGSTAAPGSAVDLVVSSGPEPDPPAMPMNWFVVLLALTAVIMVVWGGKSAYRHRA